MLSRTSVAEYTASVLRSGSVSRAEIVKQLAAWLKNTNHNRQAVYLIQDIAKKLAENGYNYTIVTTAHQMDDATRRSVLAYLKQYYGDDAQIELDEQIDPSVIGGVRIDTPSGSLDTTVKRKLIHIVKGVQT